jgi:hypothetical protein
MAAWKQGAATAGILAIALAAGGTALADPDSKVEKQVELFERILDDTFVESPNWLVQGQHESRGRYRAGQGARFSIDASLVGGGGHWGGKWWNGWDGDWDDHVIIIHEGDDADDVDSKADSETRHAVKKKWLEHQLKRQERLYSRGKAEVVDAILEYGEVLSAVPDTEYLTIEVDLGNEDPSREGPLEPVLQGEDDRRARLRGRQDRREDHGRAHRGHGVLSSPRLRGRGRASREAEGVWSRGLRGPPPFAILPA